ncbi:MAG: response regulator [Thermoanaerobaculia bacterium]
MAPPIRILHLEDRRADALLVRSVLEAEGADYEIVSVDMREAFIAALETGAFDVILSDYAVPSFDGISALRIAHESSPDVPFIFVSGTMGEELAIETLKSGATDYVLKERLSRLLPSVRRALAEASERRERRKADQGLRQSEEKYRSIVETTNDWIWESDAEGRLTYCNPAVEPMVGYRPEELLGRKGEDFLHPDDLKEIGPVVERAVAEKSGWKGWVLRWRHKDGSYRSVESNAVAVFDGEGAFRGFRGATRDITERVQLEAQFRQSQKMEAVGQLAGGVAHDFNNLLTTILGYGDLLMKQLSHDPSLREGIEEIKKAGERAAVLTRQLLAFSRKQVLTPLVLDLNEVVAELEKMLRRLIGEDIDLATVLDPSIGHIKADPGQLEQVIMNLAVNSRDAMPRGGKLTIETRNVQLDKAYARERRYVAEGHYVLLAVSDTGSGMDSETRAHIFEPFFTTKGQGKGTGLGLSTVYGIVKQSGGSVEAYSEVGQGTTFKIYLPAVEEAVQRPSPEPAAKPLPGSETILLVEDDESVRALARRVLVSYGYTVLEALNGEDAMDVVSRHRGVIHLMVTDAVMPGMSGPQLARQLSSLRPDMRVLFISGYTDDAIVRHGLLKPTEAFLPKPFSPDALVRKVREVLQAAPPA